MTTSPASAQNGAEAGAGGPEGGKKRRSRGAILFAIGFALAAILTASATIFTVSGAGVTSPANPVMRWMLFASLALSIVLAGIIVHRISRIARGQSSSIPGARLHLKFVALFSLAALAPAVVVAVFMGATLTQGLENWFSQRVRTVVESGADVGRYLRDSVRETSREEVRLMASDLNAASAGLRTDPQTYARYLGQQAQTRFMVAAYVINGEGEILSQAVSDAAPEYVAPPADVFAEARGGAIADRVFEGVSLMRVLVRLTAYEDAYLYVVRPIDPALLQRIRVFYDGVAAYRDAERNRSEIQTLFAFSYLTTAMLVLLGAIWLGLSFATRIADPIGRLASAARRVAGGDLAARVVVPAEQDEVGALGEAFNQMTAQLENQRRELVNAQREAETRSRFVQAVLAGVTAGVVGVDRDGRITAANRYAGQLLGLGDARLEGRRLIDVVPEFEELLNQPTPHGETAPHRVELARENAPAQLSVRMSPAPDSGVVLTFDDMTKVIAVQRQEAWKDVARRIAHEIKNPLTPIQLSAERLQRKYASEIKSDPEIFQRCTDTILRQVSDIGRMVDEFNAFARTPAPRMALGDIGEVARAAVFAQRLAHADVRFELEGAERPIALVCDERLLGQAFANLLKNAAESIQGRRQRDGEPKDGWVMLRLRDLELGVQFEIIDNGLGFPPDRARLLEPYVTTRQKGTGLGLAIVSRIIEDHGGLIELADPPSPPGAVVRFVLPKRAEIPTEAETAIDQGAM